MSKFNKQYDQLNYAKALYETGQLDLNGKQYLRDIELLAIYLKDYLDMKPKQREKFVYEFLEKYKPDFNKVLEYPYIDKMLKSASKKERHLKDIPSVKIYSGEIDYIKNLNIDYKLQKILFTLYIQGKLFRLCSNSTKDYDYMFISEKYFNFNSLKKQCNCTFTKDYTINDALRDLEFKYQLISLDFYSNYYLLFSKEIEDTNSQLILEITSYDNLGMYYDYLCGDKSIAFCRECGVIFKRTQKTGSPKLLCTQCSQYQKLNPKVIKCVDCGKEFVVFGGSKNKLRCNDCQTTHLKLIRRQINQDYYNKIKGKMTI